MTRRSCVQKRAAAAGVINSATIRISPTACRPMTVTATTSASMTASSTPVARPCEAAYSASKQSMLSSLNVTTAAATSTSETIPISKASEVSIDAVLP